MSIATTMSAVLAPGTQPRSISEKVCVTGATGYIAVFVVRDLLAAGYHVRGTVRNRRDAAKLAPLLHLPGADRLDIFEADMTDPSSFDDMLRGCGGGLVHTATPIEIPLDGTPPAATEDEAQRKQLGPAVDGTVALIRAAARQGVRKIVLTSSIGAMRVTAKPPTLFDESCWSDETLLRSLLFTKGSACYCLAKTLQEREATRLCAELDIGLCVICPALVIGPTLTPANHNFSLAGIARIVMGQGGNGLDPCMEGTVPDVVKGFVDVREVSEAHVRALVDPAAAGRYLLQSHNAHYAEIVALARRTRLWLRALLRALPVDSADGRRHAIGVPFDSSRAFEGLGVTRIPLEDSVRASVGALIDQGYWRGERRAAMAASALALAALAATVTMAWRRR